MRIGKHHKKGKSWKKAGDQTRPSLISPEVVVGRVSSNIIEDTFAPKLKELALERLELYASELVDFDEALVQFEEATNASDEAEVSADGHVRNSDIPEPIPPVRPLFHSQFLLDEFSGALTESSKYFSDKGEWKIQLNAATFERSLDEKYGVFRPFITNHPEIERFIRSLQRKYATGYFSPIRQGSSPIPKSTAVIILFMMHRGNVRWDALLLTALFLLVGLQPWALVTLLAFIHHLMNRRKRQPIGSMKTPIQPIQPYWAVGSSDSSDSEKKKNDFLLRTVGTEVSVNEKFEGGSDYDVIIVGSGPGALYTGALLSRAGRKVLVLSPHKDASGCVELTEVADAKIAEKYKGVPVDIECSNVSRVSRQQELLKSALCTTSDLQGGVRFAKIGSDMDGYAFEILSIPGVGSDKPGDHVPFVLKAQGNPHSLMDDAATLLGDGWPGDFDIGSSTSGAFIKALNGINASAGSFYLSKVLQESANNLRSKNGYQESSIRYASSFLNKCFPMNGHVRSLMAGIGMKTENIKPSQTSMAAHVTNTCAATSEEGMHYPVGGPRALCHALATVIEQNGGKVLTKAVATELLFEKPTEPIVPRDNATSNEGTDKLAKNVCPRCIGAKLSNGLDVRLENPVEDSEVAPVVICMDGFIDTFIRLLPADLRTNFKVPLGLPALSERRPVFKALFCLSGSAEELNVTGADFYRLPAAALPRDEIDPATGIVVCGEIGWVDKDGDEENAESVQLDNVNQEEGDKPADANKGTGDTKRKTSKRERFAPGKSWLSISFPSAKDPSWESRHGKITTCVVTIEADDEFVRFFDSAKPKIYSIVKNAVMDRGARENLMERVKQDLISIFPQIEDKIEHQELKGPYTKGLSHNPERYAAKGIRADTPYPGLFVGGSDLTVGDSFSALTVGSWLVTNCVMGYSALDLLLFEKNITSDLEQFLEPPLLTEGGTE